MAADPALELGPARGRHRLQALLPGPARRLPGEASASPQLARALDLVGTERRAVALLGAGLARRAEADDGAAGDQRGSIRALRRLDRLGNGLRIVPVDARCGPAGGLEA